MDEIIYDELPDGSVRQWHPLHACAVLSVPGRDNRPMPAAKPTAAPAVEPGGAPVCDFCPGQERNTTPEKARLSLGGEWPRFEERLPLAEAADGWAFRRFANLFEIVGLEYWRANHGHEMPEATLAWQRDYLTDKQGRAHVEDRLAYKHKRIGVSRREGEQGLIDDSACFFGGGHDVIAARWHEADGRPAGSADMPRDVHAMFIGFATAAAQAIGDELPAARHVVLFQNWLAPAGASFEHLHKQAMAIDGWGPALERAAALLAVDAGVYNRWACQFSRAAGLALAESRHALAVVEPGQPWPTVAVYSKGHASRPWELENAELKALADMLWAVHAAFGPGTPSNEEWQWAPKDFVLPFPVQVRLKARLYAPGGFEGATTSYINPVNLRAWRATLLARLIALKDAGSLPGVRLGQDCPCATGSLGYDTKK